METKINQEENRSLDDAQGIDKVIKIDGET
jgi:hypothetical protein